MLVNINNIAYNINEDEFKKLNHGLYHNLFYYSNKSKVKRIIN